MKLATVVVGVPVYRLQGVVEHSIVRKPTIFERMVMRLSRRGAENQVVGDSSLKDAFENKLGVQGMPQLLESTVSSLLQLGVLSSESPTKLVSLEHPIRWLHLTPEGHDFYNRNTLPSSPAQDHVEYFYIPWSNSLSSTRPRMVTPESPVLAFDAELLKPRDASSLIRREIEDSPPRFLKSGSRLSRVIADINEEVSWIGLEIELHASPEGYLELKTASNNVHDHWLSGLEPSIVRETFLESITSGSRSTEVELPTDIIGRASRIDLMESMHSNPTPPSIALPDWNESGLTVQLGTEDAPAHWSQTDAGMLQLLCHRPEPVPPQLVSVTIEAGRPIECQVEGDLALTWSGGLRYVRVLATLEGDDVDRLWASFSEELATTLSASPEPWIAAIPFAWGSARSLDALNRQLAGRALPELFATTNEFINSAKAAGQALQDEHAARIIGLLIRAVESSSEAYEPSVEEVDRWVRFIGETLGEQIPLDALTRGLLERATPPSSPLEVNVLLALEANPQQLPARILQPSVLASILESIWRDPSAELRTEGVGVLRPLGVYREAQAALDLALGRQHARMGTTSQRVIATKSVGEALHSAELWLRAVADPALAQAVGGVFPAGLLKLGEELHAWTETTRENVVQLESGSEALVFDSNTLMNYPDALGKLAHSEVGVIPNRVLQELDGLKRNSDERTAQQARAANRTIDELKHGSSLRFEPARAAFIPVDFGPTDDPDNQILSVAIAYSTGKVTLVTGDKNLRNKAEASNITAKDWQEIQDSRGGGN